MKDGEGNRGDIPQLYLEQYALGELPEELAGQLDASELRAAREKLQADDEAILKQLAAEQQVPVIRSGYAREKARAEALSRERARVRRGVWAGAIAAAGAVAVLLVVVPMADDVVDSGAGDRRGIVPPGPTDRVRIKGPRKPAPDAPYLNVYRQSEDAPERLDDGAAAGQGDLIQLTYVAEQSKHGVVLSLDGAGRVTLHWPETPDGSTLLKPEGETPLLHAYELDAAPLYERFLFVTSERPIDVGRVLRAARKLASEPRSAASGALQLPADWKQSDFTLKKVER
jgi:hypothetical protein